MGRDKEVTVRQTRLGNTGQEIAAVGQGTWQMEMHDRAANVRTLRRGIELGMTHIDSAEMYGSGAVEDVVGEAIGSALTLTTPASRTVCRARG